MERKHCDSCDAVPAKALWLRVGFCKDLVDSTSKFETEAIDLCLDCMEQFIVEYNHKQPILLTSDPYLTFKDLISKFKKLNK